ncbi:MAG: histidine kinase [Gammaproteobacteria bacterium]|nr:histidine kinase [Gammaproteobacteria bacterium]
MSARPIDLDASPPPSVERAAMPGGGTRWRIVGCLAPWQFIGIVFLFWSYVTASAVLYAYSMGATLAAFTQEAVFAPWQARVLQHSLLFPLLLACYAASLRLDWRPLWWKLPLQALMGLGFALLARPAILAALHLISDKELSKGERDDPLTPAFWLNAHMFTLSVASFTDFFLKYGFGLALLTGFVLYKRYHDTQLRVSALERQWSAARLAALRMQLSPHTLFNLLHTIRGNIAWDPPTAQSMIVQLADLLRRLLTAGEREWSRLCDEMQFVQLYLELQQKRFSDRLTIELPPPGSLPQAWVPSLILQPLVENAVVHGLAGHDGPVRIRVTVDSIDDGAAIRIGIANDVAPGRAGGQEGIGLRNVRERLAVQLGRQASLRTGPMHEGLQAATWRSEITMPALRELPATRREPAVD